MTFVVRLGLLAAIVTAHPGRSDGGRDPSCSENARDTLVALGPSDPQLVGLRIAEIGLAIEDPAEFPGPARALRHLHAHTREGVTRRVVGVAVDDVLGPTTLLDAVRRLRSTGLYQSVGVRGAVCSDGQTAAVWFTTRDAWSTRPSVRIASSTGLAGSVEERNVLGLGLGATVGVATDGGARGVRLGVADPTLLGGRLRFGSRFSTYGDGHSWTVDLRTPDAEVYVPWRLFLARSASHRGLPADSAASFVPGTPPTDTSLGTADTTVYLPVRSGYDLRRDVTQLLLGRQVWSGAYGSAYTLGGWERTWTTLHVQPERRTLGAQAIERRFVGYDAGLGLRSGRSTSVRWMLPDSAPFEVPRGAEAEVVMGWGREHTDDVAMRHLDAWVGWSATPWHRVLVITDVWVSGFQRGDSTHALENASQRASLTVIVPGHNGLWSLRCAEERIIAADPDMHALATLDPLLQVVSPRSGLSERAVVAELERSIRLTVVRRQALDAALFAATSDRRGTLDPNLDDPVDLYADVVGAGLRLTPSASTGGGLRLDVGYPITHSRFVTARWYVALRVAHPLLWGRRRDEWRDR